MMSAVALIITVSWDFMQSHQQSRDATLDLTDQFCRQ